MAGVAQAKPGDVQTIEIAFGGFPLMLTAAKKDAHMVGRRPKAENDDIPGVRLCVTDTFVKKNFS